MEVPINRVDCSDVEWYETEKLMFPYNYLAPSQNNSFFANNLCSCKNNTVILKYHRCSYY